MNTEQQNEQNVTVVTEETIIPVEHRMVVVMPKPERFKKDPFPIPEIIDGK